MLLINSRPEPRGSERSTTITSGVHEGTKPPALRPPLPPGRRPRDPTSQCDHAGEPFAHAGWSSTKKTCRRAGRPAGASGFMADRPSGRDGPAGSSGVTGPVLFRPTRGARESGHDVPCRSESLGREQIFSDINCGVGCRRGGARRWPKDFCSCLRGIRASVRSWSRERERGFFAGGAGGSWRQACGRCWWGRPRRAGPARLRSKRDFAASRMAAADGGRGENPGVATSQAGDGHAGWRGRSYPPRKAGMSEEACRPRIFSLRTRRAACGDYRTTRPSSRSNHYEGEENVAALTVQPGWYFERHVNQRRTGMRSGGFGHRACPSLRTTSTG